MHFVLLPLLLMKNKFISYNLKLTILTKNATKKSEEKSSFGDSSDNTAFSLLFHIVQHLRGVMLNFIAVTLFRLKSLGL